jgi:rhamnosyltransferase
LGRLLPIEEQGVMNVVYDMGGCQGVPVCGSICRVPKIFSVIVGYRPNLDHLQQLCAILVTDGASVIVVDNTEIPYLDATFFPKECRIVSQGTNSGIAQAQNVGIKAAVAETADVIVFFDQDSTIGPGFLQTLLLPLRIGKPDVVSPLCIDDISGDVLPSLRISKNGISNTVYYKSNMEPYGVDIVISSGIAATREVFQVAGLLDEGLFIDFVDTEWCLRCRSKGIPIRVVPSAMMRHRIGNKSLRLGRFTLTVHSPERCYYQIRNCFHLFRKPHIPLLLAIKETFSVFLSRMLLLFLLEQRSKYFMAYLIGVLDGLCGVEGAKTIDKKKIYDTNNLQERKVI